jgi:FKBP-type peptidyl-prolyl cis-trans isomerase
MMKQVLEERETYPDVSVMKQVLEAGEGSDTPQKGDKVTAHYTGTRIDGSKHSSRDRANPFTFTLGKGQVMHCWDLAWAPMKEGEKAVLTYADVR